MLPFIEVGSWRISTYNTVYAIALLIVGSVAYFRLRRLDVPPRVMSRGLLLIILAGFAGTYAVGVIPAVVGLLRSGRFPSTWKANFGGTLGGGIAAAAVLRRRWSNPMGRVLDLGGLPWPLLLAIGRIGCLAAGCCGGKPTHSWLGLYLPNVKGEWAVRYPTQIMSGVWNLFVFGLLLGLERYGQRRVGKDRGWPFDGFLFLLYICLFCFERFSLEFLREDHDPLVGPFSWVHFFTLAGFIAAATLIARGFLKRSAERHALSPS